MVPELLTEARDQQGPAGPTRNQQEPVRTSRTHQETGPGWVLDLDDPLSLAFG